MALSRKEGRGKSLFSLIQEEVEASEEADCDDPNCGYNPVWPKNFLWPQESIDTEYPWMAQSLWKRRAPTPAEEGEMVMLRCLL